MLKKVIYSIMWMLDRFICYVVPVMLCMLLLLAVVALSGQYIPGYLIALYLLIGAFICVCITPLKDKASVQGLVCLVVILSTWPVFLAMGVVMTILSLLIYIFKWIRVWCGLDLERDDEI